MLIARINGLSELQGTGNMAANTMSCEYGHLLAWRFYLLSGN